MNVNSISLMSHITELIIRIQMNRACNKIEPKIGKKKNVWACSGHGSKKFCFIIKMVSGRTLQIQKELYLYFTDCAKEF